PASPVRPSTARPEFTALLDQLRAGTLPPRPRTAGDLLLGQPASAPDEHTLSARAQRAYAPEGYADAPAAHPAGYPAPVPPAPAAPERDQSGQAYPAQAYAGPGYPAPAYPPQAYPAPGYPAQGYPAPAYPAQGYPAPATGPARPDPHGPEAYRTAFTDRMRPVTGESSDRGPSAEQVATERRAAEERLTGDRRTLRQLGVPAAWTRRLRPGDRFSAVLRMLERMPDVDIDPDVEVVALVGPRSVVQLEAHRTALDLPLEDRPRPVVVVPADGRNRGSAIAKAHKLGTVVVAIETEGYTCDAAVVESLQTLAAGAVIAVVDADRPVEESQRWLDGLGQVDAVCVDNTTAVGDPAGVLQLGLPVVRLDGIPVDRVTWTALLCAQLEAADPAH
ncbi:MAG TPA: hypothetical protein VFP72_10500, partial [Kineosporiaceae bacterium]|nr:hypothetical protein [Kineosporiaceae bacterium]